MNVHDWLVAQRTKQKLNGEGDIRALGNEMYYRPVACVPCRNGVRLSVQASVSHYCVPRTGNPPWTHVEVGFIQAGMPQASIDLLQPYAEDNWDIDDTFNRSGVFAYVPVEIVDQVVLYNGGISRNEEENMQRLFMLRKKRKGAAITGEDGKVLYFANKMDAKKVRDAMGGETVVSLGPDHWRNNDEQ